MGIKIPDVALFLAMQQQYTYTHTHIQRRRQDQVDPFYLKSSKPLPACAEETSGNTPTPHGYG